MKTLALIICLFSSLSAFAQTDSYYTKLLSLRRVQSLSIDGEAHVVGYITNGGSDVFYRFPEQYEYYMKVTMAYGQDSYTVEVLADDVLTTFSINSKTTGTVEAKKQSVKLLEEQAGESNVTYWRRYEVIADLGKSVVVLNDAIVGASSIAEGMTVTAPMEFSPCDGCEHGDQMNVGPVNAAELDFGPYYIYDCEGEVKPLLAQLLETSEWDEIQGLAVPFTVSGFVSLDSGDLIEDTERLWLADSRRSQIYIGYSKNLTVRMFLDSLVFRTAAALGLEAYDIQDDVMNSGKFTSYANDVLTFSFKGVVIKTNLRTGRTVQ